MNSISSSSLPVMLVDDETEALRSSELILASGGIDNIILCQDSSEVLPLLEKQQFGVVILDLSMPRISGEELLPELVELYPDTPIIIVTGANEVATAVACMQMGAFDYMVKPVERSRIVSSVRRALELRETRLEYSSLKESMLSDRLEHPEVFADIITRNRHLRSLLQYIETVSKTSKPILITGETGVGKELIARAVHTLSGVAGEFVSVNVAGLDDNIFSDTLFGHVKGAYTGATDSRSGLVEKAAGGTLFLDEIGDLSPISQVKLLRLIQEHEYMPLGADINKYADARIVASTNKSIDQINSEKSFRKDLYYRLKTHHVHLPPLRERPDDIPLLLQHFVEEAAGELGKKKPEIPGELPGLLAKYDFPGNVRELKAMVFDAVSSHKSGKFSLDIIKDQKGSDAHVKTSGEEVEKPALLFDGEFPTIKEATQLLIEEALSRSGGNQTMASRMLGISQSALSKRLKRSED